MSETPNDDLKQARTEGGVLAQSLADWLFSDARMGDDDTDYTRAAAHALLAIIEALADDDPEAATARLFELASDPNSELCQDLITASCGGFDTDSLTVIAARATDES